MSRYLNRTIIIILTITVITSLIGYSLINRSFYNPISESELKQIGIFGDLVEYDHVGRYKIYFKVIGPNDTVSFVLSSISPNSLMPDLDSCIFRSTVSGKIGDVVSKSPNSDIIKIGNNCFFVDSPYKLK